MPEDSAQAPADDRAEEADLDSLLKFRRQKLDRLRELGVDPFGAGFPVTHAPGELREAFAEGLEVRVAGRVTALRDMGKTNFIDLSDLGGRVQAFINRKEIGEEAWEIFRQVDLGDWLGVEGETFLTRTGEPTVKASRVTVLSKAMRPLPDKWHGVADPQIKYRQRYLDLIANQRSRDLFQARISMIAEIRRYLHQRGFLEVETPMLQDIPGGAAARPFETFHNALGMEMSLRIAPELYLKRLLVGGFTKVFELNRNFRNEGISRRHNPEFTMLEAYWAYADFERMAELVEDLICHLAETHCGGLLVEHKDEEGAVARAINLARPWRRASYRDLVKAAAGDDWFDLSPGERRARCGGSLGVEISPQMADHEVTQQVFEKLVEEKTIDPLFVTHVPAALVPLAKQNEEDPSVVDVYELVINGAEISPGYSELNDPAAQRRRLAEQVGEETHKLDEDFLLALEHGMPPAGGFGVGIDRLVMMLTGAESIRDVILFPQLKRRDH